MPGPTFLSSLLELDIDSMGEEARICKVRRVCEPRSKIKNEVIAEFSSPVLRDTIKGMGFKFEGRDAGIRMEVPTFLRSDFHVLQNLSYRLKLSNRDMKRSLKFDDHNPGLILDIQFPEQEWQRIRPDQARSAGRTDPSLWAGLLELSGETNAGFDRRGGPSQNTGNPSASGGNAVPLGRRDP